MPEMLVLGCKLDATQALKRYIVTDKQRPWAALAAHVQAVIDKRTAHLVVFVLHPFTGEAAVR